MSVIKGVATTARTQAAKLRHISPRLTSKGSREVSAHSTCGAYDVVPAPLADPGPTFNRYTDDPDGTAVAMLGQQLAAAGPADFS